MPKTTRLLGAIALAAALTLPAACGGDAGAASDKVATLGGAAGDGDASTEQKPMTEEEIADAQRAFASCMREHGVDMPDPEMVGGGVESGGEVLMRVEAIAVNGEGDAGPMGDAFEACNHHIAGVASQLREIDPEDQAKMLEEMRAFSKCMREHGVDMPDPQPMDGGRGITMSFGGSIDVDSATFQAAQEACQKEGGGGPGFHVSSAGSAAVSKIGKAEQ